MFKSIVAGALALGMATAATAAPIVLANGTLTAVSALAPTPAPFGLVNLGTSAGTGLISTAPVVLPGVTITFVQTQGAPLAGVYAGTVTNTAVSPYTGTTFGVTAGNGQNRNYLAAQPGNNVLFTFSSAQTSFNALWGTVDSFNEVTLEFLSGGSVVASQLITGSQVAASAGISANGSTPAYVSFATNPGISFNSVVLRSIQNSAFELAPGLPTPAIPEPATWGMMILGFGIVGASMRRRRPVARVAA